jgi:YVTN family beta-propeller protein
VRPLVSIGVLTACVTLGATGTASAGPFAYVTRGAGDAGPATAHQIAVFDAATGSRVGSIPMPAESFQIAIGPGERRAYVTTQTSVVAVDLAQRKVVKDLAMFGGTLAFAPDGKRVFATDEAANQLIPIDTATNTAGTPITVGDDPRGLVVDTQAAHAYTGNTGSPESVSIVDLTTNMETSRPTSVTLDRPENLAIAPSGGTVYAANFGQSAGGMTVSSFAPPNGFDSITVGTSPLGLMTNPSGTRLYVATRDSGRITIVNTATNAVTGSIKLPFGPTGVAVAGDGVHAVVTGASDDKLAFLDLATRKIVRGPITLSGAYDVAIAPVLEPRAAFTVKPGISRTLSRFDASPSKGGPIAAFSWDFGDGEDAAGASPKTSHRYAQAGKYTVTLFEDNTCDADAVFGPLGVAYGGQTAFCAGKRTATKTKVVRVPKAAVAAVRTKTATVSVDGDAKVKLACVRELPCKGKLVVAWKPSKQKTFVRVDRAPFGKFQPKTTRTVHFHVADKPFAALRAKGSLSVKVTAIAANPHQRFVKRSRKVKLIFPTGGSGSVSRR